MGSARVRHAGLDVEVPLCRVKRNYLKWRTCFRAQADAMNSRDAKQAFRKMADYYQREAEQLQGRPVPEIMPNKQAHKSAA